MIYPMITRAFIDVNDYNSQFVLALNRGDSARQLQIFLTINGENYNPGDSIACSLTAIRADGKPIFVDGCQYLGAGRISCDIDTKVTGSSGEYDCQLIIRDTSDGSQVACAKFRIIVEDLNMDASSAAQSSEFVSLEKMVYEGRRLVDDLTQKRELGYFDGKGIHIINRAFESESEIFYPSEILGSGNVKVGSLIIDSFGKVYVIDSMRESNGAASFTGTTLRGDAGTSFWFADAEWGGTTALSMEHIVPIEGKKIAIGDIIVYTNCEMHRVEMVTSNSVVVEKNGLVFKGKDGYTPQKGVDYFDGIPATHSWNGSVLTVSSASGSSSADLKGPPGDTYVLKQSDKTEIAEIVSTKSVSKNQGVSNVGKILAVGADGNLTLTDMPSGDVGDIIGTVGENNAITLTGDLNDGTYVFKYENADGSYSDIGTLVVGGVIEYSIETELSNCTGASGNAAVIEEGGTATLTFTANNGYVLPENVAVSGASYTWVVETGALALRNPTTDVVINIAAVVYTPYTNVLPLAQEYASSSPYVDATTGAIGYGESKRLSSSSQSDTYMKPGENVDTTGLIPVKRGDIIRLKNCNFKVTPANQTYGTYINGFKADKSLATGFNLSASNITVRVPTVVENGEYTQITLEPLEAYASSNIDSVAYIMISTDNLDETSIITINEEITE